MHNFKFNNTTIIDVVSRAFRTSVMILALATVLTVMGTTVNVNALGGEVLIDTYEVMDTTNDMQVMVLEEQIISEAQTGMGMSNGITNWTATQVMTMATTPEPTITTGMKNSKGIFSKLKKALKSIAKFVIKVLNVVKKLVSIFTKNCRVLSIVDNGMGSMTVCGVYVPRGNPIP
jgi:hypothetical protein